MDVRFNILIRILCLLVISLIFNKIGFSNSSTESKIDTSKILEISRYAYSIRYSNNDSARICAEYGLKLSIKIRFLKGYLLNLHSLATSYYAKGDFDKSERMYKEGLKIAKASNETNLQAIFLDNLANIYILRDDKTVALNYYLDALKIHEKNNNIEGIKKSFLNIGLIYKSLKLNDYAEEYILKFLKILNPEKDAELIATLLFNYAVIYKDEGDLKKSKMLFYKTLDLWKNENNYFGLSLIYIYLGEIEIQNNNVDNGFQNLNNALNYSNKAKNIWVDTRVYLAFGSYYYKVNNYDSALVYLLKAYHLSKECNSSFYTYSSANLLSKIYSDKKEIESAYYYSKEAMSNQDSVIKSDVKITVQNLQIRNDYEKNQKKLMLIESDNQKNKLIRNTVLAGASLLLLFLGSLFVLYRKVLLQKKELQQVNATKDKLFSIISHDLRSPFHILRGYLWMINNKAISQEQFRKASGALIKEVDNIFLALENLLNWAKDQMNGIIVRTSEINLSELVSDVYKTYHELANQKNIILEISVDASHTVLCDRQHIDLILRNTLNNAVKFSRVNGHIHVRSIEKEDFIVLEIEDDGIGIPEEKVKSLFSVVTHFSGRGTFGEKGTGLGLILCKEFIEKNGGQIHIESRYGLGTKVLLTFMKVQ